MDFLSKLDKLMEERELNKHTLAQQCGIPYTTIIGLYERGIDNARLSTLNKLSDFFDVPLDYLVIDRFDKPDDFTPNGIHVQDETCTDDERELLAMYRELNNEGKQEVKKQANLLITSGLFSKKDNAADAI